LALAGGGPLGAIWEIGALCALQDGIPALRWTGLQHYVGVSAGGFVAAGLANGIGPRQLYKLFIEDPSDGSEAFDPAWLLQPAWAEFWQRGLQWPALLWHSALHGLTHPQTWLRALERLSPGLPTGLMSHAAVDRELTQLFSRPGRSNDFRQLPTRLRLVATHLDSCKAVAFGSPGWDHVPISKALLATAALPGLFAPVNIDGQHFVDGALLKTLHASVALDEGVDLMFCLNPLVPFDATPVGTEGTPTPEAIPAIAQGGLPAVLSQTFRALIHSRLDLGLKHYARAYPHTDIVLVEPDARDAELHRANTFSYRQRRHMAEHAYQSTRAWLLQQGTPLQARLQRHGLSLDRAALADPRRSLLAAPAPQRLAPALAHLRQTTQRLQQWATQAQPPRANAW